MLVGQGLGGVGGALEDLRAEGVIVPGPAGDGLDHLVGDRALEQPAVEGVQSAGRQAVLGLRPRNELAAL